MTITKGGVVEKKGSLLESFKTIVESDSKVAALSLKSFSNTLEVSSFAWPRLDHHKGLRERMFIGDRHMNEGLATCRRDRSEPCSSAARQAHRRLAARKVDDAHVAPEHSMPEACA